MNLNPYLLQPLWARRTQHVLFMLRYALLASAGLVSAVQDIHYLREVGVVLLVSASIAFTGAATRRFHVESVPLWFIIAALVGAASVLYDAGRFSGMVLVVALIPALCERLLYLIVITSWAREQSAGHADE